MLSLKMKALVYKYTGVFLAHKEENEYLQSKECWKSMLKLMKGKDKDLANPRNAQGLLIGLWQAKHGFCRPMSLMKYRRPRWFFNIVDWFVVLYITLKWDVQSCLRKKKNQSS